MNGSCKRKSFSMLIDSSSFVLIVISILSFPPSPPLPPSLVL